MNHNIYLTPDIEAAVKQFFEFTAKAQLPSTVRAFKKVYYYNNEPSISRLIQKALKSYLGNVKK